jgi:uncharacterized protein YecT (DUF1311 family)
MREIRWAIMMKFGLLVPVFAIGLACPSSVSALDCTKASSKVEKLFCTTPQLKQVDEAMSATYFKLLRETTDPDFHEALIQSQRRWLKIRSDGPDRFGQAEDNKTDDRDVLLQVTRDRLAFLQTRQPIRTMEEQREARSKDGGGPLVGFKTYCALQPPPYGNWSYECWGSAHRQNNGRVCSSVREWASGHISEYRLVSLLKDGEPRRTAFCSTDDGLANRPICPGTSDDPWVKADAHWDTSFDTTLGYTPTLDTSDLWKYDPDVQPDVITQPWLHDCLFAPVFLPSETSRPTAKGSTSQ